MMDFRAKALAKPIRFAILAQIFAGGAVVLCVLVWPSLGANSTQLALAHGVVAALITWALRMPSWWIWIGALFGPLAYWGQGLALPPWVWLVGFFAMMAVFWRTDTSRVPLYMTNTTAAGRLISLIPARACRVIDLGCGDGRLLRQLAQARPDCEFVGYEHAPLTWFWAKTFGRRWANLDIRYGSFWTHSLASYDMVYAFLSPAPMPRLWAKVEKEMLPCAVLVSNSFVVPGVACQSQVAVDDKRGTILYCYSVGGTT